MIESLPSGFNLPPGVFERDIPGNRPKDEAWENIVDEVDPAEVLETCSENNRHCDEAIFVDNEDASDVIFDSCLKSIVEAAGGVPVAYNCGADLCPYMRASLERRLEDRMNGTDDPRSEPEYWEDR